MVVPATLLLAALTSAPATPAESFDRRVCDEADAEEQPPADEALTPSVVNCSEPAPAPEQMLDCNDERARVWVQEMIGSCDMPRGPALRPAPQRPASATCVGASCANDPPPLTASARSDEHNPSAIVSPHGLTPPRHAAALDERAPARPRSAPSDRLERPPRA
jgi:hypothetical protein